MCTLRVKHINHLQTRHLHCQGMASVTNALSLQLALKVSNTSVTIVGNRMTTDDVDVSLVLAQERYGSVYPNIQEQLKKLVEKVREEMEKDVFLI